MKHILRLDNKKRITLTKILKSLEVTDPEAIQLFKAFVTSENTIILEPIVATPLKATKIDTYFSPLVESYNEKIEEVDQEVKELKTNILAAQTVGLSYENTLELKMKKEKVLQGLIKTRDRLIEALKDEN